MPARSRSQACWGEEKAEERAEMKKPPAGTPAVSGGEKDRFVGSNRTARPEGFDLKKYLKVKS